MAEITIEDYVAPAAAPHKYADVIQSLIDAGPTKVATGIFDTEDEALTYVREMQAAARQVNKSALKRALFATDGGKVAASVSVRDQITRKRGPKSDTK